MTASCSASNFGAGSVAFWAPSIGKREDEPHKRNSFLPAFLNTPQTKLQRDSVASHRRRPVFFSWSSLRSRFWTVLKIRLSFLNVSYPVIYRTPLLSNTKLTFCQRLHVLEHITHGFCDSTPRKSEITLYICHCFCNSPVLKSHRLQPDLKSHRLHLTLNHTIA